MPIGQMEKGSSCPSWKTSWDIQAKEPDAGLPLVCNVGPNIDFGKVAKERDFRAIPKRDAFHVERYDSDIGFSIMKIDFELIRDASSQIADIYFPVDK